MMAVLMLESDRLAGEASRWMKALCDLGETVSPGATQAKEQASSCYTRIEMIKRLIESVSSNTYPTPDVSRSMDEAARNLMASAIKR